MIKTFVVKLISQNSKEEKTLLVLAESKEQAARIVYQCVDYTWLIDSTEETTNKVFEIT